MPVGDEPSIVGGGEPILIVRGECTNIMKLGRVTMRQDHTIVLLSQLALKGMLAM